MQREFGQTELTEREWRVRTTPRKDRLPWKTPAKRGKYFEQYTC